jgi:hypothetical protein
MLWPVASPFSRAIARNWTATPVGVLALKVTPSSSSLSFATAVLYCTRKRQRAKDRIGSSRQSGFAADRSYKRGPIVEIRQINIGPERATEPYFASARTESVDYDF